MSSWRRSSLPGEDFKDKAADETIKQRSNRASTVVSLLTNQGSGGGGGRLMAGAETQLELYLA
jgi:hypothetical protein